MVVGRRSATLAQGMTNLDKSATRVSERTERPSGSRWLLLAGFGGMALLMALAGIYAIAAIRQVQENDVTIYGGFLQRNIALERIRWSIVLSAVYARDYLVDPDPQNAADHLQNLLKTKAEIDVALQYLHGAVPEAERALRISISEYWDGLLPVFDWTPLERRQYGYEFLARRLLPQRARLLSVADTVGALNGQQLEAGRVQSEQLFADFTRRMFWLLGATLGLALFLGLWTSRSILSLEQNLARRYQEIQVAQENLEALSKRLVDAQEEERRNISRELHDEVGQTLSALLVELGNVAAEVPAEQQALAERLHSARTLGESSVNAVRNMSLLLRPSMLDDFGLVPALHWQAREMSRRTGMNVTVDAEDLPDTLPDEHKTCIYRLVQEALNNAAKHSSATSVKIRVEEQPERLRVKIEDNGKGFDTSTTRGMGLVGMEERVRHLKGILRVDSIVGQGTTITVELPL